MIFDTYYENLMFIEYETIPFGEKMKGEIFEIFNI